MCAIIASFDPEEVKALVAKNSYRGNFSWSITGLTKSLHIQIQEKGFGEFPIDTFDTLSNASIEDLYWVCHVQAPTGGMIPDKDRIHPVMDDPHQIKRLLWHNGVIKRDWIRASAERMCEETEFDTALILYELVTKDIENKPMELALEDIDGSFACVYLKEGHFLKVFRNTASPMFVNGTSMSSAMVNGMEKLDSEVIFDINLKVPEIQPEFEFNNINKPFYFGGR